jgi:hypothetical protein
MSGYPCRGWRDNSNEQGIITDITSCDVVLFRSRREGHFRVLYFRGIYYQEPIASLMSFTLFARFERKDHLSSGFAPYSKLLDESLETFFELGFLLDYSKGYFRFG